MKILDSEIYQLAKKSLQEFIEENKDSEELKYLSDPNSEIRYCFEQGYLRGFVEGWKKGYLKVAQNMKRNNIPVEEICSIMGLTKEEVEKL